MLPLIFLYNIIILPSSVTQKSRFDTITFTCIYIYTNNGRTVRFSFFRAIPSLFLFTSFSFRRAHINRESTERVDIIIVKLSGTRQDLVAYTPENVFFFYSR